MLKDRFGGRRDRTSPFQIRMQLSGFTPHQQNVCILGSDVLYAKHV